MITIYIGSEPKLCMINKVLEHSLRVNQEKKIPLNIKYLEGIDWKVRPNKYVGTGFSLLRWDIPRMQNYEGFAIYMDADILCLGDIHDLWKCDISVPNREVACWCTYQTSKWFVENTPETSVMLIDCQRAKFQQPNLDESIEYINADPHPEKRGRYIKIMRAFKHKPMPQAIPKSFNRLNTLNSRKPNLLLHYTKEPKQPWYNPSHPHKDIFEFYLKDCLSLNLISKEEMIEQLEKFRSHTNKTRGEGLHPYYRKLIS